MTDDTDTAAAVQPSPEGDDRGRSLTNLQVLSFLAGLWMRQPVRLAGLVGFSALATAADVTIPILAGRLVDALAQGPGAGAAPAWRAYGFFLAAAVAFYACRQAAFRWFEVPMTVANMEALANDAFARVQRFSADWHANMFGGSIVRRITRAMQAYDMATMTLLLGLGPTFCVLYGLSIYMLFVWLPLGLYALAVVVTFMTASLLLTSRYIRPANRISNALDSRMGGMLADAVGANAVVKAFGAEAREDARFGKATRAWRVATHKTWLRFVNAWFAQILAVLALQAGLVGLLVSLWSRGQASPGDVVFAIAAFMLMAGYLRRFGEEVQTVQRSLDQIEDVAIYAMTPLQIADASDAAPFVPAPPPGRGAIAFDRVGFGYVNQGAPIYQDFSLDIGPGERIALVGPTGSGKSTFVKLLQRLYDVEAGAIRVDGQDVRAVTQESLRRAIALVPQDPALFHRSVGENIAYGRPDATDEGVEAAARRAHAHDFIMALPKGYDTLVGERGVKLSGGERQRVAIARALLADAPILVLDEATSSLDTRTEAEIQAAMDEAMRGRTTIVIAHRLSTIRNADRILVFDKGRVVEQGGHAALVSHGGVYARLHALAAAEG
jgi:ATP-binding cassette subfamily B protein